MVKYKHDDIKYNTYNQTVETLKNSPSCNTDTVVDRFANLREANLRSMDLRDEDFRDADLRDADLRDTDLRDVDLRNADLNGADLCCADLRGADLNGADIDFASFSLWWGSLDVHLDDRQLAQLAYYLVRNGLFSKNASKETKAELSKIIDFANKFHGVKDCGRIEVEE